jgi:glucokinase
MKSYIALDVGGTSIAASVVSPDGRLLLPVQKYPALSNGSKETIVSNLVNIINKLIEAADTEKILLHGIGMGFPGPFDYENGISLMMGLQKFDAIYGVNILNEIKSRLKGNLELRFKNDVDLYCMGECKFGVGRLFNRCLCISIGTGINTGFFADGKLVKSGEGIPEDGWIYDLPYRDGIVTDYVSAAGIRKMMEKSPTLSQFRDVKELAQAAFDGLWEAERLFKEFGDMLYEVIWPFAIKFKPEAVILGGDVSRSHSLFERRIKESLKQNNIEVVPSIRFSDNALLACAMLFENGNGTEVDGG